jgi:hypothetical protein
VKVNLVLGDPGAVRSGYLNLDVTIQKPEGDRLPAHPDDFGHLVSPNELTELVCLGVIDRIPGESVIDVLRYWASRLAHGGTLAISALDMEEVAAYLATNDMQVTDLDSLIYTRRSAHTMRSLSDALESLGLKVVRKDWQSLSAFLTAVRP